jgi:hypothetical protein
LAYVNAANILCIYPTSSFSHQIVFRALTKDLVARGHNLTVITSDPIETNNPNLTQIDFSFYYEYFRKMINFVELKEKKVDEYFFFDFFMDKFEEFYDVQLGFPAVQKLIKNEDKLEFDLVIVEYLNYVPWYAFAKKFNAPLIGITSLDAMVTTHEEMGNVFHPALHPEVMLDVYPPLNFQERWRSLKYYLLTTQSKKFMPYYSIIIQYYCTLIQHKLHFSTA